MKPYLRGAFEIQLFPSENFSTTQIKNNNTEIGGNTKKITGKNNNINKNTSNNVQAGELSISVALLNNISPYAPE